MTTAARRPLMADVARAAAVSTMTVSRVLNGHPHVSAATRQRVEQAVAELGYHANMAARTLAGGRSHVIGAISVQPATWGPSRTVFAIEAAAQAAGHLVSFKTAHEPSVSAMREAIDELRGGNAEGVIVVARLRVAIEALRDLVLPMPLLVTYPTSELPLSVGVDQELGARLATRHLVSLGHERVIHVRGPKGWIDADDRANGWRKELRSSGATGRMISGDWTPSSGYDAGVEIAADLSATAVFVANDQMALGVQLALHEAGRSVPDDVSVVGFDDVPEAGFYIPPLTTVRQDFAELGRMSVERLLAAIEGRGAQRITIAPQLVQRASTAPPSR
jgi:DNA-binding LacI/PurR family transcriptional regulator